MHLPLGKWGCLGCSTVPGTGKPLTSCSQVQERVLLWNSVLRCCCNSSELYSPLFFISPTVHILLVWNFPVSRSTQFPEATVCFLLPKSLGPCLLLGAHTQFSFANGFFFFFFLLACFLVTTRTAPVRPMSLHINQGNGHCSILFLPRNCLLATDVVSSGPVNMHLSILMRGSCQCSFHGICPAMCAYSSLPLGWTQPALEMWDSPCLCWK